MSLLKLNSTRVCSCVFMCVCVCAGNNKHVYAQVCSCVCEGSLYVFNFCAFVYFKCVYASVIGGCLCTCSHVSYGIFFPSRHGRAHLTVVLDIFFYNHFHRHHHYHLEANTIYHNSPVPQHKYFSFLLIYPSEVADLKWACG